MIEKGIVSSVNIENNTARVILSNLNNTVTNELLLAESVKSISIGDIVAVAFYGSGINDGFIVGKLQKDDDTPTIEDDYKTYTHNQLAPLKEWNIIHNLNKYPSVTIVDSANNVVVGDITYINENIIKINFLAAFSGAAYLN